MFITILTGTLGASSHHVDTSLFAAVAIDGLPCTWREKEWLFIIFLSGNNDFFLGISLRLPILWEKNKQSHVM